MDLFELLKLLHVLAAVAWVGGAILSQAQIAWVRSKSPQAYADFIDFQVWPVFNLADGAIVTGAVLTRGTRPGVIERGEFLKFLEAVGYHARTRKLTTMIWDAGQFLNRGIIACCNNKVDRLAEWSERGDRPVAQFLAERIPSNVINAGDGNNLAIGDDCIVGAAANVVADVPSGKTVVGLWKRQRD